MKTHKISVHDLVSKSTKYNLLDRTKIEEPKQNHIKKNIQLSGKIHKIRDI